MNLAGILPAPSPADAMPGRAPGKTGSAAAFTSAVAAALGALESQGPVASLTGDAPRRGAADGSAADSAPDGGAADAGAAAPVLTTTPLGAEAAALYELFVGAGDAQTDFSGIIRMIRGELG